MSKRTKIIIIVVIVIIGLAIALFLSDKIFIPPSESININEELQPEQQAAEQGQQDTAVQIEVADQPIETLTPVQQSLYNTARNFAERYGSFSTDSNFANLEEVKLFSTPKMIDQLDAIISTSQQAEEFYGVTSKVLNIEIEEMNESQGFGQVTVLTQRQEIKEGSPSRVYYQNLELYLIKSGGSWLVDEANWL